MIAVLNAEQDQITVTRVMFCQGLARIQDPDPGDARPRPRPLSPLARRLVCTAVCRMCGHPSLACEIFAQGSASPAMCQCDVSPLLSLGESGPGWWRPAPPAQGLHSYSGSQAVWARPLTGTRDTESHVTTHMCQVSSGGC